MGKEAEQIELKREQGRIQRSQCRIHGSLVRLGRGSDVGGSQALWSGGVINAIHRQIRLTDRPGTDRGSTDGQLYDCENGSETQ